MPDDELAGFGGDPDLSGAGASLREEWRAEEEEYGRAAAAQWTHRRRLVDVATELMHRGDTVAITTAGATFTGTVTYVAEDLVTLRTPAGRVDVHAALPTTVGRDRALLPAPLVIRVVERARAGGLRPGPGVESFRARLHEYEADGREVVVGSSLVTEELRGLITLGRDHVHVRSRDGAETYLPTAWIAYVMPWRP